MSMSDLEPLTEENKKEILIAAARGKAEWIVEQLKTGKDRGYLIAQAVNQLSLEMLERGVYEI